MNRSCPATQSCALKHRRCSECFTPWIWWCVRALLRQAQHVHVLIKWMETMRVIICEAQGVLLHSAVCFVCTGCVGVITVGPSLYVCTKTWSDHSSITSWFFCVNLNVQSSVLSFVAVGFKMVISVRLTALFDDGAGTNLSPQQVFDFFVCVCVSAPEPSLYTRAENKSWRKLNQNSRLKDHSDLLKWGSAENI